MGGSWIVKLPSAFYKAVPENEFAMLELARRAGISVPENRLVDIPSIKGLPEQAHTCKARRSPSSGLTASQRGAVHMEDFAQVFGRYPNHKYKFHSYANIAASSGRKAARMPSGNSSPPRLLRADRNADMHLKNWSLLYPDRRTPVLSPGYDLSHAVLYSERHAGFEFRRTRSLSEITPEQMRRFCRHSRIPASPLWQIAVETAERYGHRLEDARTRRFASEDLRAAIEKQILGVAATTK